MTKAKFSLFKMSKSYFMDFKDRFDGVDETFKDNLLELYKADLRDKKIDEAYTSWARDVRDRAYVEIREAPL